MIRLRELWKRFDGPIGVLLIIVFVFNMGYMIRGYEDGGVVATLIERIRFARTDERNQCSKNDAQLLAGYQERSKLRDNQVATLIAQNRVLISMVATGAQQRSKALAEATAAANKAADAASALDKKANEIKSTTTEINKRLDTATQPTAVVPRKDWGK